MYKSKYRREHKTIAKKRKSAYKATTTIVKPPFALTKEQGRFIDAIHHKEMIITLGPAGTGKTYLSASYAGYYHHLGKVDKIILTRPTVPTGKSIGFFPGTLEEKMDPWIIPFKVALEELLTKQKVEMMFKKGDIEIVPFETIRGRSFDNAFVVLDEAQNCTEEEIKAFLTRHGKNCTTIINGDISQSDLSGSKSGLALASRMVRASKDLAEEVTLINFTHKDIVRSGLCKLWVKEFENSY